MEQIIVSLYGNSSGKSGLDGKKNYLMFLLIYPASKCEHNKMDVFLEKYLVKFSYVFPSKKGESDDKCHLKIEVLLVSCFQ